jgi:hypothetical protein
MFNALGEGNYIFMDAINIERTTITQITMKMIWLVRIRRCSRVIFFF